MESNKDKNPQTGNETKDGATPPETPSSSQEIPNKGESPGETKKDGEDKNASSDKGQVGKNPADESKEADKKEPPAEEPKEPPAPKAPPAKSKSKETKSRKARAFERIFVSLRVYAPINNGGRMEKEILRGNGGVIRNENQLVKLEYNTPEWHKYLGSLKKGSPWFKIDVEKVINQQGTELAPSAIPGDLQQQVDAVYQKPKLTPEQRESKMAQAQAILDELKADKGED